MQNDEENIVLQIVMTLRRSWWVIASIIFCAMVGAVVQHRLFPEYIAKSSLIIRTDTNSPLLRIFSRITGNQGENYAPSVPPGEEMAKFLRSSYFENFILESVRADFKAKRFPTEIQMGSGTAAGPDQADYIANYLMGRFNFKPQEDLIYFYGYSKTPREAEAITKWIAETAKKYLIDYENRDILETEKYLLAEIDRSNKRISDLTGKINSFRYDPNLVLSDRDSGEGIVQRSLSKIREEMEMVKIRKNEIIILLKMYQDKVKNIEQNQKLAGGLYMRGRMIDAQKELVAESEALGAKEKSLTDRFNTLLRSLKPQSEQVLFDLKKRLDLEHSQGGELQRQLYATRILSISAENKIRTYEAVDRGSASRNIALVKKLGFAVLLGLCLAMLVIFMWEHFHPVMSFKHDFLKFGVQFLGTIPNFFNTAFKLSSRSTQNEMFVRMGTLLNSEVRTAETNALHLLAARMIHALERVTKSRKGIIAIASSHSGEGKTLMANCLSVAVSSMGLRVLLVDGDTLRTRSENIFGLTAKEGLLEVMAGQISPLEGIRPTQFKNIYYYCSGLINNRPGLMSAENYKNFLNTVSEKFDIIIVDTPAFSAGPEAMFLSGEAHLAVLVTVAQETKQEEFGELVESLQVRGLKNLFGLFNRSNQRTNRGGYYYYGDRFKNSKKGQAA